MSLSPKPPDVPKTVCMRWREGPDDGRSSSGLGLVGCASLIDAMDGPARSTLAQERPISSSFRRMASKSLDLDSEVGRTFAKAARAHVSEQLDLKEVMTRRSANYAMVRSMQTLVSSLRSVSLVIHHHRLPPLDAGAG